MRGCAYTNFLGAYQDLRQFLHIRCRLDYTDELDRDPVALADKLEELAAQMGE